MKIDYSQLQKSIANLKAHYQKYKEKEGSFEAQEKSIYETAIVKSFEIAFEMAWKHLKKYLESEGLIDISNAPKQIFRMGHKANIIEHVDNWLRYCESRNQTSHDYNLEKTEPLFGLLDDFINDAEELYHRIANDEE